MAKYPRPSKQFDFIGKRITNLSSVQSALLRRTDYRGTTFDDGVGSQSKAQSEALKSSQGVGIIESGVVREIKEVSIDWSEADGYEITGPTYLTLNLDGMDLLKFRITADHSFEFYSNTRNMINVRGKIEKLGSDPEADSKLNTKEAQPYGKSIRPIKKI